MGIGTINQNIPAINALRNLQNTDRLMNKSLEGLSSGLRINKAADDAAGLAVSEKMRGQISGIRQAKRNAQDGVSMIQTAEAVMTSVHNILQRMRVLSVQAANDSYSTFDRQQLQKEFQALINEVDRISEYTEFNTKKIINGETVGRANTGDTRVLTATIDGRVTDADYSVTILDAGSACNVHGEANLVDGADNDNVVNLRDVGVHDYEELHISIDGQIRVIELHESDTLQDVVYKINKANIGIKAGMDGEGNDITMTATHSGSRFNISFGDDPDGVALKLGLHGGVLGTLTSHLDAVDSFGNSTGNRVFTSGSDTIISITHITPQSMFRTNPGNPTEPGGYGRSLGVFTSNCRIFSEKDFSRPINDLTGDFRSPTWQDDVDADGFRDDVDLTSSNLLKGFTLYVDEDIDYGVMQVTANDYDEGDWTGYWPDPFNTDINGNSIPGDPNTTGQTDHAPAVPNNEFDLGLAGNNTISLTTTRLSVRDTRQIFHTGPSEGHTLTVEFGNLSSAALGLTVPMKANGNLYDGETRLRDGAMSQDYKIYCSIETQESAEHCIGIVDEALNKVSHWRASLGAYQNALGKTIEYLEIADENLSASESRIRDIDMAEEMSNFTRHQILIQSGTAMLAQANAKPQGILQLLQ
ncbi:MAG: flagellin [Candidatus Wallbacteria bacterium]|nr:flagellin [Candidatus Wallbacteria bacterium]